MAVDVMHHNVPDIFARSEDCLETYKVLIAFVETLDGSAIEEKKASVHVVVNNAAYLGVHPRKNGLRVTIVLERPLGGEAIKIEQVSKKRFYNDVDMNLASFDDHVKAWIREAYKLKVADSRAS